ncbi:MmgE/PrpD family protein [Comamonas sp. NoAH]|uniref:MmgE/PrpD family protein n=1 Tax=Comamonas halotolerans TaxID=3041496 RepID=UPI0024E1246D|nr:MmgE/PrpD family protein [Comamonas sp. NoAH]
MYISEQLGQFGSGFHSVEVNEEVIHHAKRAIVDWYAALIPGYVMEPTPLLEKAYVDDLDRGSARLALGRKATMRTAALINGSASHTAEVDDIFKEAIYHPGAPTISAALAVAQQEGAGGLELIKAVIVGYEISTRIGKVLGRSHYKFWHNTGTVGTFGAAAAAAYLLKLNALQFTHALCTGATFAAGLQQAFKMDSMSKPLHSGRAAEAGVAAAQMARQGVTGSLDVFEGSFGMGVAMSNAPEWQPVMADLGERFNINAMTFKNHACCGHTFAPIDGALLIQQRDQIAWEDIARIVVQTYSPALSVAGNPAPRTPAEARFSIPFVVSTALRYGSVRLAAFDPERLQDPDLLALMRCVELQVHPQLDAQFPGQRAAQVTLYTKDGRAHSFLQPTRKGDPDMALTDAELQDKFDELVIPVLGKEKAERIAKQLWNLQALDAVDAL